MTSRFEDKMKSSGTVMQMSVEYGIDDYRWGIVSVPDHEMMRFHRDGSMK